MNIKRFKCPICGCELHYGIKVVHRDDGIAPVNECAAPKSGPSNTSLLTFGNSLNVWGDASLRGDVVLQGSCSAYVCSNCGRVEFFMEPFVNYVKGKLEELRAKKRDLESEIESLKIQFADSKNNRRRIQARLAEVKKLLSSDEITVKEQRQLTEEKEVLNADLKNLIDASVYETKIANLEKELSSVEKELAEIPVE